MLLLLFGCDKRASPPPPRLVDDAPSGGLLLEDCSSIHSGAKTWSPVALSGEKKRRRRREWEGVLFQEQKKAMREMKG